MIDDLLRRLDAAAASAERPRAIVLAVLRELREPAPEMIDATDCGAGADRYGPYCPLAIDEWRAMLDALLERA